MNTALDFISHGVSELILYGNSVLKLKNYQKMTTKYIKKDRRVNIFENKSGFCFSQICYI